MGKFVLPSDFYFAGLITPSEVCRHATPAHRDYEEKARRNGWTLNPGYMLWTRAVELEGQRWSTDGGVSQTAPISEIPSQSNYEQCTTNDLAKEFGCTPGNIRDHVRRGRLSPARREPHMLFDRAEVERFKEWRQESA